MAQASEKLPPPVNPEILKAVSPLSVAEGREPHALVEEALGDLLEKRKTAHPRAHTMAAYSASGGRYGPPDKKLAE
jgi:hypothetical protein